MDIILVQYTASYFTLDWMFYTSLTMLWPECNKMQVPVVTVKTVAHRYMMSSLCEECLLVIVHNFKIWQENVDITKTSGCNLIHTNFDILTCSFNQLLQWVFFLNLKTAQCLYNQSMYYNIENILLFESYPLVAFL